MCAITERLRDTSRGGDIQIDDPYLPVTQSQGSHASWKVLDFFLENSGTWKVLENHFGPGMSWKNMLESHAFF